MIPHPPQCLVSMGCLCAGHARGAGADVPCCAIETFDVPAFAIEEIAFRMFADTVVGRMLRKVCEQGTVSQASLMAEYHVRCERSRPSRSSYACQFGRFSTHLSDAEIGRLAKTHHASPSFHYTWSRVVLRQVWDPSRPRRRLVVWRAPNWDQILMLLPDESLADHFVRLEAQMLAPRDTDELDDATLWLGRVRDEQVRRVHAVATRAA